MTRSLWWINSRAPPSSVPSGRAPSLLTSARTGGGTPRAADDGKAAFIPEATKDALLVCIFPLQKSAAALSAREEPSGRYGERPVMERICGRRPADWDGGAGCVDGARAGHLGNPRPGGWVKSRSALVGQSTAGDDSSSR